jgi:hypothetical protein
MATRGRPQSIDWETVTPELGKLRAKGATYTELADYVESEYGTVVSYQTIRTHLVKNEPKKATKPSNKTEQTPDRRAIAEQRVLEYIQKTPWASVNEIVADLKMSTDAVIKAREKAVNNNPGYTIIPPRSRRETYSETEMLDALADAMEGTGSSEKNPMSRQTYVEWRDTLPKEEKKLFPSPLAYRRKYGSWGDAMEAAGLPRNERMREYEGINKTDAILWIAHFLRDVRISSVDHMKEATAPAYRSWLRANPEAPSEELLRIQGNWGELLIEAAQMEINTEILAAPRPVWTGGRNKAPRVIFLKAG